MDKSAYILEMVVNNRFIDSAKEISKTTNNPSSTIYISNLGKDFIEFDKVKMNYCQSMSSVDTVVINENLYLFEFKKKDISRLSRQKLQDFLKPIKLKMLESIFVLIESYNSFNDKIDIYDLLQDFGTIKMRIVLKQNSINPNNRTRLRNYGIELGRILGSNNIDFLMVTGSEFDSKLTNFNVATQTI